MIASFSKNAISVLVAGCVLTLGGCGSDGDVQKTEQQAATKVVVNRAESAHAAAQKAATVAGGGDPSGDEPAEVSEPADQGSAPDGEVASNDGDLGSPDSNDSGSQTVSEPPAPAGDAPVAE